MLQLEPEFERETALGSRNGTVDVVNSRTAVNKRGIRNPWVGHKILG